MACDRMALSRSNRGINDLASEIIYEAANSTRYRVAYIIGPTLSFFDLMRITRELFTDLDSLVSVKRGVLKFEIPHRMGLLSIRAMHPAILLAFDPGMLSGDYTTEGITVSSEIKLYAPEIAKWKFTGNSRDKIIESARKYLRGPISLDIWEYCNSIKKWWRFASDQPDNKVKCLPYTSCLAVNSYYMSRE